MHALERRIPPVAVAASVGSLLKFFLLTYAVTWTCFITAAVISHGTTPTAPALVAVAGCCCFSEPSLHSWWHSELQRGKTEPRGRRNFSNACSSVFPGLGARSDRAVRGHHLALCSH